ncbi:MAG: DUF3549 family protein [Bacterioplanes sp.]|nr:DUF3549 family protein [Bacterioplanes sp.]
MTIVQWIEKSGAQMRVFDLGRRIEKISKSDFARIEQQAIPYPSPYLRHAWLGILTWNPKQAGQHTIWFLKLPLDEQNQLQPGPRDAFLRHWAQVVMAPDQEHGEAPYSYKPDPQRMAYFHALALQVLGQEPTRYYQTARAYLSGDLGWDNWQNLGLQGLAETVARIAEGESTTMLATALPHLPAIPRNSLLTFLENIEVGHELSVALNDCLSHVVSAGATEADLAAFVRAFSHSVNHAQRAALLQVILAHPHGRSLEVLAAMGSRCWQDLRGTLLQGWLENLALNEQGQAAFNALVGELMALPGCRDAVMSVFREPQRSEALSRAIGALLQQVRQASTLQ